MPKVSGDEPAGSLADKGAFKFPFGDGATPLLVGIRWVTSAGQRSVEDLATSLREEFTRDRPLKAGTRCVFLTVEALDPESSTIRGWVWTEMPGASSEDVRLAGEELKESLAFASRHLDRTFDRAFRATTTAYVSIALSEADVQALDRRRLGTMIGPAAELDVRRLRVGNDADAIGSIERFLRNRERERRDELRASRLRPKPSDRHQFIYPLMLGAALLATWLFPITGWTAWIGLGAAICFFTIVIARLLATYEDRWSLELFKRGPIVASAGLTGIFLFGIFYAVIAIAREDALPEATRLGDAYLLSTSLGVAGGLIGGELSPVARFVAHIQLLFIVLGGIVAAAIALLELLNRTTPERDRE